MHFLLPLTRNSWPSTLDSPFGFCSREIQWCISSGVSLLQWITRFAVMITKEFGLPENKSIKIGRNHKNISTYTTPKAMSSTIQYTMQKHSLNTNYIETLKSISCVADLQTDECRNQINGIKHLKAISKI